MNRTEAHAVTDAWVAAWNAHDVDAVLEHFADGVVVEGNATYADEKDPAATRTD